MEMFMEILQNFGVLATICFAMGYYIYMQHKTYRSDIEKITTQHREEVADLNAKHSEMVSQMRDAIERNTQAMVDLRVLLEGDRKNG